MTRFSWIKFEDQKDCSVKLSLFYTALGKKADQTAVSQIVHLWKPQIYMRKGKTKKPQGIHANADTDKKSNHLKCTCADQILRFKKHIKR